MRSSLSAPHFLVIAVLAVIALVDVRGQSGARRVVSKASKETTRQLTAPRAPTYYRDVLPILAQHCVVCHSADGIAPMAFDTYAAARSYAFVIRNVTQERAMPPPFAVPLVGRVANDPSLTAAQISTLAAWANLNTPEGDPHDAPRLPRASAPWSIAKPDLIVKMPEAVSIPASGNLEYVYQLAPTHFTTGRWIQAAELLPSARANILQIVVAIRRPDSPWLGHAPLGKSFTSGDQTVAEDDHWADDDILIVYSPGSSAQQFAANSGKFIPAGADLVFRAQYITNGVARCDQSSLGLVFSEHAPARRIVTLALQADRFTIPPSAPEYRVEARGVLQTDALLLSFFPVLHLRGKRFEYDVIPPRAGANRKLPPKFETLLRVNYEQRWQASYQLCVPRILKKGTELRAVAWYDNSPINPNNPNPDAVVHWGNKPQEEVLEGFFDVAVPTDLDKSTILIRP